MTVKEKYDLWLTFDEDTRNELLAVTDEAEIEDRFYKELEFGTGGLRGVMGAGANRMNKYTVGKATKGLADYLGSGKSVVIAYDSRLNSSSFALHAALVLCAAGIKVYLFERLMPTPVLSFSVRHLSCDAGIVITASHNPKKYNGYKVYDSKGCQLVPNIAEKVIACVNAVEDLKNIPAMSKEEALSSGLLTYVGDEVLDAFLAEVRKQSVYGEKSDIKIVYTPLHGTGNIPVRRILEGKNVIVVPEQELPDGNFSTVRSPNPEEKDALNLALALAEKEGADIVIGTDPDCDRVGVGVRHNGSYVLLTGNQTGALLTDFVVSHKQFTPGKIPTVVKTIVTNTLGASAAQAAGLSIVDTLTGFKYIGEQICRYEESGDREFVFGYEESYGYLAGTYARDKDAVVASMLISEMAAYYRNKGMTLVDAINALYDKFGAYCDRLETVVLEGKAGAEKIRAIMDDLREKGPSFFDDVDKLVDYSVGIGDLPKENVLKYFFADSSWIAVRPSGTEPKLKIYYSICDKDMPTAEKRWEILSAKIKEYVENF